MRRSPCPPGEAVEVQEPDLDQHSRLNCRARGDARAACRVQTAQEPQCHARRRGRPGAPGLTMSVHSEPLLLSPMAARRRQGVWPQPHLAQQCTAIARLGSPAAMAGPSSLQEILRMAAMQAPTKVHTSTHAPAHRMRCGRRSTAPPPPASGTRTAGSCSARRTASAAPWRTPANRSGPLG